jgi:hypothetical protein
MKQLSAGQKPALLSVLLPRAQVQTWLVLKTAAPLKPLTHIQVKLAAGAHPSRQHLFFAFEVPAALQPGLAMASKVVSSLLLW